jgi:hypothetical protein
VTITEPGVYELPEEAYHADPVPGGSLSSSGARKLLPPSCPAIFHYERGHSLPPRKEFEVGSAAHKLALGVGPELVLVDRERWDTKEVKEEVAKIRAWGGIPLKRGEYEQVHAMAAVLRAHPRFGDLFGDDGVAEQSLFWQDRETGVWCRARPDWMTPQRLVDYKTTTDVSLGHISSAIASYGYYIQAPFYLAGAVELDMVAPDAEFTFVFQSKTPPYLVSAVEVDDAGMRIGYQRMVHALEIFRDCTESGIWPGYSPDIETVSLPAWLTRAHEMETW